MDGKLGISVYNDATEVLDLWLLQNYEDEVWVHGYNIKLPVAGFREPLGYWNDDSFGDVASVGGDLLLLVSNGGWMFYVDTDGKLVDSFHRYGQLIFVSDFRLKQTLVPHDFLTALEGHAVNTSPFL
jgi:hypothetical protein